MIQPQPENVLRPLLDVMAARRRPKTGYLWDKWQDALSPSPYEVADAIVRRIG